MTDWGAAGAAALEIAESLLLLSDLNKVQAEYNGLARKYFLHYQQQREFYFTIFQMQGEGPFVYEQFGITVYVPDYFGMFNSGYFPPGAWYLFAPQLANRKDMIGDQINEGFWKRFAERYSPNVASVVLDTSSFAMDMAALSDDWNSYMNRYEEHKRDVFNERRWANRMGALQFGIKEGYAVEREMATSFDVFDKAQGQLVSSLDTIGNGLATFAGYRQVQNALQKEFDSDPIPTQNYFLVRSPSG